MKIRSKAFRVRTGAEVDLARWPTASEPVYKSNADYEKLLARHVEQLSSLQRRLFASNRYSVLLIFQAMDAAGKDGVIRHVMSGVNPQGCQVVNFKKPSETDLQHDFLWRAVRHLPARGQIGIFNRSYYEEVLIARVHPRMLAGQGLTNEGKRKSFWRERYRSIASLERHLQANGTRIVKIYLHLSNDEQRERFIARMDEADKNWKLDIADVKERRYWKEYRRAYQDCLAATATGPSPWYIVPADDKKNARLIVSQIVVDTLKDLKLRYPKIGAKRRQELLDIRRQLVRNSC
jgi:PPK2 family polyphosphate:nucleotide phosphotransferase